uniref:Uncharacterized protein n=1 Tax=Podarcis muralis TaxID=64176 RepID=A0A670JXJ6_PODMU
MCSVVPGYSPGFKKPPEVLRLKRKRARRSDAEPGHSPSAPASAPCALGGSALSPRPYPGSRRRNPFSSLENSPRPPPGTGQSLSPARKPRAGGAPSLSPNFSQLLVTVFLRETKKNYLWHIMS